MNIEVTFAAGSNYGRRPQALGDFCCKLQGREGGRVVGVMDSGPHFEPSFAYVSAVSLSLMY